MSEFIGGGGFSGECLEYELRGRSAESLLHEVVEKLSLSLGLSKFWVIDVGSLRLVTTDEALFGHDLEEFEDSSVSGVSLEREHLLDLAHGHRT